MAHMLREALESPADQRLQQTFGVMGEDECRKLLLQISRAHPALAKVRTKYKFIVVQGKERRVEEKHKPSQMSGLAAGMAIGKQLQRWCPEVSAATVGLGCDCCRLLTVERCCEQHERAQAREQAEEQEEALLRQLSRGGMTAAEEVTAQ